MAFVPDIVVTGPDTPHVLVAVEAKTEAGEAQFQRVAREIRQYLFRMSSPVGLVVFPERLWVFHNTYAGTDESAIEQLGPYDLPNILWENAGVAPQVKGLQFEAAVQTWLEHLAKTHNIENASPDLNSALETYLFPALNLGIVRAAGPRSFLGK
jgi:hypothetical protein